MFRYWGAQSAPEAKSKVKATRTSEASFTMLLEAKGLLPFCSDLRARLLLPFCPKTAKLLPYPHPMAGPMCAGSSDIVYSSRTSSTSRWCLLLHTDLAPTTPRVTRCRPLGTLRPVGRGTWQPLSSDWSFASLFPRSRSRFLHRSGFWPSVRAHQLSPH